MRKSETDKANGGETNEKRTCLDKNGNLVTIEITVKTKHVDGGARNLLLFVTRNETKPQGKEKLRATISLPV